MTRQTVKTFLADHFFQIAGIVAAVAAAWTLLGAQVDAKADSAEVQAVREEVESLRSTMQRVDERTARIERYLCRTRPDDIGC